MLCLSLRKQKMLRLRKVASGVPGARGKAWMGRPIAWAWLIHIQFLRQSTLLLTSYVTLGKSLRAPV